MNILDKLPKRLITLLSDIGGTFSILNEKGVCLDLDTGMKSHAHLYYENGKYILRMRYSEEAEVETLGDVLYYVRQCMQGRDYANYVWFQIMEEGFGEFSDEPLDFL